MSENDNLDWTSFVESITVLDGKTKLSLLVCLAHRLTIYARDTYQVGTADLTDPSGLRAFNEVMHRLTSRIFDLSRDQDGWKESEFWQVLLDVSQHRRGDIKRAAFEIQRVNNIGT